MLYAVCRFLCWAVLRGWCGYRVEGYAHVPRRGPYIVAANHVSYLDPPVVGAAFRPHLRFIAKDELFQLPWLGPVIARLGAIPVQLSDPKAVHLGMLKAAARCLKAGDIITIFPEGRRNATGQFDPPKLGLAFLALHTGVPVVPVAVVGTAEALPPGARRLRRSPITVRIGQPLLPAPQTGRPNREACARFAARVAAAMAALLEGRPQF